MKKHILKTHPEYFKEIILGNKKFEIRKNDRGFEVGDELILKEYDPEYNQYTENEFSVLITYILENAKDFGLMDGYCIISFI